MWDHVLIYLNGKRVPIAGDAVFSTLVDLLRERLGLYGTKVGCGEGDCGCWTVLAGVPAAGALRYRPVAACIQSLHQLEGTHIVTIEGLAPRDGLSPIQQAMIDHHGSQCGYCTPGDDLVARAGAPVLIETGRRTFFRPHRLEDAVAFRARHPGAIIVSGGTELGVQRNKRGHEPAILMSLAGLIELARINRIGDVRSVGANVTWAELEAFSRVTLPARHEVVKLYKISKRKEMDSSTFRAGIRIARRGDSIGSAAIAYSGVGPTVRRLPLTETFLAGRPFSFKTGRPARIVSPRDVDMRVTGKRHPGGTDRLPGW
ncbi:MAG: FAD binding domain-containing protein [Isosphaerales bacterium]